MIEVRWKKNDGIVFGHDAPKRDTVNVSLTSGSESNSSSSPPVYGRGEFMKKVHEINHSSAGLGARVCIPVYLKKVSVLVGADLYLIANNGEKGEI